MVPRCVGPWEDSPGSQGVMEMCLSTSRGSHFIHRVYGRTGLGANRGTWVNKAQGRRDLGVYRARDIQGPRVYSIPEVYRGRGRTGAGGIQGSGRVQGPGAYTHTHFARLRPRTGGCQAPRKHSRSMAGNSSATSRYLTSGPSTLIETISNSL